MGGWILRVAVMLIPIAGAMGRELITRGYIQADETPLPVQLSDGRGKNQASLWNYGRPGGDMVFEDWSALPSRKLEDSSSGEVYG